MEIDIGKIVDHGNNLHGLVYRIIENIIINYLVPHHGVGARRIY